MADPLLKQKYQAALKALGEAPMALPTDTMAHAVFATLLHFWTTRTTVVQGKLLAVTLWGVLEQRASQMPQGWLSASIDACGPNPLEGAPDEAARKWLSAMVEGGAASPLARGLGLADVSLVDQVMPDLRARQAVVNDLVRLAGRPTTTAQGALVHVLAAIWREDTEIMQARALFAMTQDAYLDWLAADTKTDRAVLATYFTTKIKELAAKEKVPFADGQKALADAMTALFTYLRALPAPSAPALVAAVAPTAAVTSSAPPAQLERLERLVEAATTTMAAMATAMDRFKYPPPAQPTRGAPRGAARGRGGRGRGRGGGRSERGVCFTCGNPGHYAKDCALNASISDYTGIASVTLVDAAPNWRWQPPQQLLATAHVRARQTAEEHALLANVDTGAPISAIDAQAARRLGCIVKPYTGPPLATLTGSAIKVGGQTSITVKVDDFVGVFAPVVVVPELAWPLLIGLQDMARTGAVHVDFSAARPTVRLGARPGAGTRLAGVRTVVETEGVPALRVVSQLASDIESAHATKEHADRAGATLIPSEWAAERQDKLPPAIDYHSEAETRYRNEYHKRNANAHKLVNYGINLTPTQRARLERIVAEHATVFAVKEQVKPPVINTHLEHAAPIPFYLRPGVQVQSAPQPIYHSYKHTELLENEARVYLESGRGTLARRALTTAISFVTAEGRVVHSYLDANKVLLMTSHLLPNTETMIRKFAAFNADFFNYFDFREGYSQLPLAEGSGAAACIRIGDKIIEPKVLTMGVHAAPGEFSNTMSNILSPTARDTQETPALRNTTQGTYIDDSGQACRGFEACEAGLRFFLGRCKQYGITLTASKCWFGTSSMTFCGSEVEGNQIRSLHSYRQTIIDQGRPVTREELVKFLGMVGWVQPFLHEVFDDIAGLRQLFKTAGTSKNAKLSWTPAATRSFKAVREALANPDVLYAFDETRTLFVLTDASNLSASCLFMQIHEDDDGKPVLRLVNALCHNFTEAEKNYTTPEQELAALRHGRQRLPHLMLGRTIVWLSDNTAVTELISSMQLSRKKRLRTTAADLAGIRIIAAHVSGDMNLLADALSRNPALHHLPAVEEEEPLQVSVVQLAPARVLVAAFQPPAFKSEQAVRAEAVGFALARIRRIAPDMLALAAELQVADDSIKLALEAADKAASWRELYFSRATEGALSVVFAHDPPQPHSSSHPRMRLVVPKGLREPILDTMHAATAHGGRLRFLKAVTSSFWWPTMTADVNTYHAACDACTRAERARSNGTVGDSERDELLAPSRPGDVWQLDSYEWGLPSGQQLLIVGAKCVYSGFVVLERVADKTAASAARILRLLHDHYGPFRAVHHDGGSEFKGEFERLAQRLGALQTRGTPRNSNSQALIERTFRSLNDFIVRAMAHNAGRHFALEDLVSAASSALNSTWSAPAAGAPSSTPFSRFFGRPAPLSLMLAMTTTPAAQESVDLAQFVVALANAATVPAGPPTAMPAEERAAWRAATVARSAQTAAATHGQPIEVRPGDLVFLVNQEPPAGKIVKVLASRLGPFRVVEVIEGAPGAPIKARISLLGDTTQELAVLLRDLQRCGAHTSIDDPVLRTLPESGYFVARLAESDAPEARAKLQAMVDQVLTPAERRQVQQRRADLARRAALAEGNRPKIQEEEDDDDDDRGDEEDDDDDGDDDDDDDDDESSVESEPEENDDEAPRAPLRRSVRPPKPSWKVRENGGRP